MRSSAELGMDSREPRGTIMFASSSPRLSRRSQPKQCLFLWYTVFSARMHAPVVVQTAGWEGSCAGTLLPSGITQSAPLPPPGACSPQRQRCSGQGLRRQQTAAFLLKEAGKRAGAGKGVGKEGSWDGVAAQAARMSKAPHRPSSARSQAHHPGRTHQAGLA